ncbi:MAG: aldo/keto reductase [Acidimicrobiales bacterium]|nr:aldo/keto reductase [Acidimicrobiales bacterium]
MQYAPFGRTGHDSSRIIFGAAALWSMEQAKADEILELATVAGINHIDTAASYGDSELLLHDFLQDNRSSVFLATKTGERTGAAARAELEKSFERLGVDSVDLIQLHNLVDPDEWAQAFAPDGALAAMVQARDEGLVNHIGVTGHGVTVARMHIRSLDEFDFASVLFPYNHTMLANPAYRADVDELLALCAERQVAVQTIKAIAIGRWPEGYDGPQLSWYEPLTDSEAISRAVGNVLSNEQLFLNTTSDARLLPEILMNADYFPNPTDAELDADVEAFGMTPLFDDGELATI